MGGIVIFDDYNPDHPNVMRAWHDFKAEQRLEEELVPIDHLSSWFRKRNDVKVDWSKYHQDGGGELKKVSGRKKSAPAQAMEKGAFGALGGGEH